MTEIMKASNQWFSRPDDQRFLSLDELHQAVTRRRQESVTTVVHSDEMRVLPKAGGDLRIEVIDQTRNEAVDVGLSNWSFGQLCQAGGAPASYMRKLPNELAAINLQWGLERGQTARDQHLAMYRRNGDNRLTALTSTTYGRIWDQQVVEAVQRVNGDGRWQVPAASYAGRDPKRATTLYASDRDVFIFLVDPNNQIDVGGETMFRGFMTWNSEVGKSSFGLMTFLYRYVCDNRIVWGATDIKELRIRHTGGAPERFAYEGQKQLQRYANESTQMIVDHVKRAKQFEVGKDDTEVSKWLQARGFTKTLAQSAVAKAEEEEGGAGNLWNVIQGVTAHARGMVHTDSRVDLERKAGDLMKYVAA